MPPAGPGWLHEIKYDGFRMLARRDDERVRLFTRNANDWTERYPLVAETIGALKALAPMVRLWITDAGWRVLQT
jgi:ATP-dependent DNA ligase